MREVSPQRPALEISGLGCTRRAWNQICYHSVQSKDNGSIAGGFARFIETKGNSKA
jgi:hypothetical protein